MNDERQGLPSASSIHRLQACPGSHRMCAGIPDKPTDDSDFGNRVHEFLAGKREADTLTPEELDIAEDCQEIEARMVAEWKLRNQITDEDTVAVTRDSERLWLTVCEKSACSGVADVVYQWGRSVLILDYKTLPGDHADSDENLQLRCLACLVDEKNGYMLKSVDVAIIQPLVTHSPTVCHYDTATIDRARTELVEILLTSQQPAAPLRSGDHCKFCRAASVCPEVRKEVETLSALTIHESGLTVPDEDIAALRGKCGMAKKMIAAIEAEAFKRAQADPAKWREMGWEIKEGAGRRSVEDVRTVSERLNEAGCDWPEITAACSITIGDVEALTRKATGAKGVALKDKVSGVLLGCVTVKTAKPSLKRIGKEDEE